MDTYRALLLTLVRKFRTDSHQKNHISKSPMVPTPNNSPPPSPPRGVIALHTSPEHDWQPILQSSNQVVLYNPKSHALSISHSSSRLPIHGNACPFCKRILPEGFEPGASEPDDFDEADPTYHTRKPDYFQLLSIANESSSGPPPLTAHEENGRSGTHEGTSRAFPPNTMAEGYFKRFFQEEYKLGMGANGSVYLCQVSLCRFSVGHVMGRRWLTSWLWEPHNGLMALKLVAETLPYSICSMGTRLVRGHLAYRYHFTIVHTRIQAILQSRRLRSANRILICSKFSEKCVYWSGFSTPTSSHISSYLHIRIFTLLCSCETAMRGLKPANFLRLVRKCQLSTC